MNPRIKEETLDPEDWDALRALGHHMLDDMIDYHKTVRDRPIWKPFTDKLAFLNEKVPRNPQGAEKVYQDFQDIILDANPGATLHPRFWGWVVGTGTPFGMLAEILTAGLNLDSIGSLFISYPVEKQVLEWFKEIFGYPREASGILVSGCSMANLVGLTVARNNLCEYDIRKYGLKHSPKKMTIYCSSETHSSIQKAVELLGLGSESLRYIPVNEAFQIDLQGLKMSIIEDRDAGNQPFCVVGNAGTVNTGAFDDLNLLAGICKKENLWFHVDGAFGAWTVIAPKLRHLVAGLAKADSLAFDLHKWMNLPYEIGCVLVRNEATHRHTFSLTPEYLERTRTELDENLPVPFREYGIQLSRSFRALKAWMCFKEHGIEKYGRLIQQNVDQARYLANLVDEAPELERFAPVSLNIVCFRYKTEELNDEQLNELNDKLLSTLRYNGIAILSNTTIDGKFVLRACNVNHRTKYEDMEFLVQEIIKLGHMLKDPEAL